MSNQINKTIISQGSIVPNSSISISPSNKREQHTTSLKQSVLQSYVHQKYSHINDEPKKKVFFYQLMGMIMFVVIALSVKTAKFADINVAVGVLTGVVISGPVSGANLNPMVTFCNCFRKQNKFKWNLLPVYYLAQFLGALIAIAYCQLIDDFQAQSLQPLTKDPIGCIQVIASQAFGSFILIFFILQISNPNTTFIDNQLSGYMFIVVFVHTARKYAASSHQCINSMIAFTFALVHTIQTGQVVGMLYFFLWLCGDFIGTIIAVFFYERLFQPNVQQMRKLRRQHQDRNIQSILAMSQSGGIQEQSAIVMRIQKIQEIQDN